MSFVYILWIQVYNMISISDDVHVVQSWISMGFEFLHLFCVVFCKPLFVFWSFFFWPLYYHYLLPLPLCVGVSRVRALSPAWTGSPVREPPTHTFSSHTISPPTTNLFTFFSGHICLQSINYFRQSSRCFVSIFSDFL